MDEIWERAVETALDGQTDVASVRTLTLDGAVKCVHGRLPPPSLFEKFQNLQHLSLANIGLSSLDQFPHLLNLQKLILSDNRIAGGLELLVDAGLASLRDLDLSNNRIQEIDDLKPLAELKLVSLDLYECPVTRVKDYRSRVFGLIRSLRYLDKMDAEENERPESDEEEEDEDDEEDDPGSGEVDGEDGPCRMNMTNGHSAAGGEGIVDVDEEEESDADEEGTEALGGVSGSSRASLNHHSNGFGDGDGDGDEEEGEDEEDNDWVDEIDEEDGDGDGDEDVVEVHEIEDSDDDEEGVEDDDEDDDDGEDDEDEDEEEVDNDEGGFGELASNGRLTSTEGEIDGHEQGEEDGEDDNGETGEEEQGVEEDAVFEDEDDAEEEEEDYGAGYLVQPVVQAEEDGGVSDVDPGHEGDDPEMEEDVEDEDGEVQVLPPAPPSSSSQKRKRDEEDDSDGDGDDDEEDDDVVEFSKSSKHP